MFLGKWTFGVEGTFILFIPQSLTLNLIHEKLFILCLWESLLPVKCLIFILFHHCKMHLNLQPLIIQINFKEPLKNFLTRVL